MNVTVIHSTDFADIIAVLPAGGAHFTNGTYAPPAALIVPTTLAGFEHVNSVEALPMVVAINSDVSMRNMGKGEFESQLLRAEKIKRPLAEKFPNQEIYIIFYDEPTPVELYKALAATGRTATLHKWGYGTTPEAPRIEGAEFFKTVYAFPLPNDTKPVCWFDTAPQDGKPASNIQVVDLRPRAAASQNLVTGVSQHRYAFFAAGVAVTAALVYAAYSASC